MSGQIDDHMKACRLCPRECGVDRASGQRGYCGADAQIRVVRAALHFWEEPCISGKAGSGAVFFSGCSLGCVYCQNAEISGRRGALRYVCENPAGGEDAQRAREGTRGGDDARSRRGLPGRIVSVEHLADIFLRLQETEHALNINLVTAAHYIPQVAEALRTARIRGLRVPVIYNSSGYEKADSLRMLDGLVDVYLPDYKYITPALAKLYSNAEDYPRRAAEALAEMVRQTGPAIFSTGGTTADTPLLIRRGVIVRHLLLPGHVSESRKVVKYLHETYGNDIYISLMNQYTPMPAMREDPLLHRKVTAREYGRLVDYAIEIGVENGFIQEGGTAEENFIPPWNGEGVE